MTDGDQFWRGDRPHVALLLGSLHVGGAERSTLRLASGLVAARVRTDLVVADRSGPWRDDLPSQVRLVDLGVRRLRRALAPLAVYLRREQPDVLLSRMSATNVLAILARMAAGTSTRLVATEASIVSQQLRHGHVPRALVWLMRRLYRRTDALVAICHRGARDLEDCLGLPCGSVHVVYNPVVDRAWAAGAAHPAEHPWLVDGGPPVVLAVGRLVEAKDYPTLLRAFARLRQQRPARLLIFGEGDQRTGLQQLASQLGIACDFDLPGWARQPAAAMQQAAVFALSSRYEGLGNVLIEALASGCPVAATDCPGGPAEILDGGRFGCLAPVGDDAALAAAIAQALDTPWNRAQLVARGNEFSVERAVARYLELALPTRGAVRRSAA